MTAKILCLLALSVHAFGELPAEAAALKAKRDAKVAEIDRIYTAELEKIQKRTMDSARLEAANEIQKEIERVTPNPFLDDKLAGTRWRWGSGGELTLQKGGKAVHSKWAKAGKWKIIDKGSVLLKSDTGREFTIRFAESGDGIVAVNGDDDGTVISPRP